MSNKEIKEALEQTKGITTLDHSQLTPKQVQAIRDIDCFAHEWLSQQATLIDQQAQEIERLNGLLNKLDSYIDFSEPLDKGDWGIEDASGINALFFEIYLRGEKT